MWGQWIVDFPTGKGLATLMLNIDKDRSSLNIDKGGSTNIGVASFAHWQYADIGKLTDVIAEGLVNIDETHPGKLSGRCVIMDLKTAAPKPAVRPTIAFEGTREPDNSLHLQYSASFFGEGGSLVIPMAEPPAHSPPDLHFDTWEELRRWISNLRPNVRGPIFRGQSEPWPLTTTFHREGRRDLIRYVREDLAPLREAIIGLTKTDFNIKDKDELHSLLHLAQHHGYPTPLLDWTASPYIAAYFAFAEPRLNSTRSVARLAMFDREHLPMPYGYHHGLDETRYPFLEVRTTAPLANPRALPQQSVSMVTNVADIEALIRLYEGELGRKLLTKIDVECACRDEAMRELDYMGLTPATLFPGLDGLCKTLRSRHFPAT